MSMILWDLYAENGSVHFELKGTLPYKPMWNKALEILYVLTGSLSCTIKNRRYDLSAGDFILFNPYEMHWIESKDSRILSTFFHPEFLKTGAPRQHNSYFQCCSTDTSKPARYYDTLRSLLADMFILHMNDAAANDYQISSYALQIIAILNKNFVLSDASGRTETPEYLDERLIQTITYIDQNYANPLTIDQIAKQVYLSPRSLTDIFRKNTGISISQYVRMIRLAHAQNDLVMTSDSVSEIALRNGFADATSFISNFKKYYRKTPLQYRKHKSTPIHEILDKEGTENEGLLNSLLSHASREETDFRFAHADPTDVIALKADWTKAGRPVRTTWNELMNVGWAKEALLAPVQEQIHFACRELGFRSIRFHGIFDDDMQIYHEASDGQPIFNFTYVDTLFDFLVLKEHLDLHLEFGFVPRALAKDKTSYYNHHSHPCAVVNIRKWRILVFEFVMHCIERYGMHTVSNWRFEIFSSKFIFYNTITADEWWDLYQNTYETVKQISPDLQFGLNNDLALILSRKYHNFSQFLNRCKSKQCAPDFIALETFHGDYNFTDGYTVINKTLYQHEPPTPHSEDPDYLKKAITNLKEYLTRNGFPGLPVYIEHWNSTDWQQESSNDTLFKACFLVKNIIENQETVEAMGYWTLSDFMEEVPHKPDLFHGGVGILTYNGIPKASWYAYTMLHALGNTSLDAGEGYIVTKSPTGIVILLYHYEHDELIYQMRTNTRGEDWLASNSVIKFTIQLENLPKGSCNIQTTILDRDHGSSYDTWVKIGAPSELLMAQADYIQSTSRPITIFETLHTEKTTRLQYRLHSNEVYLIKIEPRIRPELPA